jgi:hypothetical protein
VFTRIEARAFILISSGTPQEHPTGEDIVASTEVDVECPEIGWTCEPWAAVGDAGKSHIEEFAELSLVCIMIF